MSILQDMQTYTFLWKQITNLHSMWQDYKGLFEESPETVAVLNKTAPGFFGRLQWILMNEIVLTITRILTDPSKNGKNENLCFEYLVEQATDKTFKDVLKS